MDEYIKHECELCGKVAEVRPLGPCLELVCYECMMKDEPSAERAFAIVHGLVSEDDNQ